MNFGGMDIVMFTHVIGAGSQRARLHIDLRRCEFRLTVSNDVFLYSQLKLRPARRLVHPEVLRMSAMVMPRVYGHV